MSHDVAPRDRRPPTSRAVPARVCCAPVGDRPLSEEEAAAAARVFAALADPARLRLLSLLAAAERGEVSACDLVSPLGRSQPTVSHHLKVLHAAGLVERERRGAWVWYRISPEQLDALRALLAVRR